MKVVQVISTGKHNSAQVIVRDANDRSFTRHVRREPDGKFYWRPTKTKWVFDKAKGLWEKIVLPVTRLIKDEATQELTYVPVHEVYSLA